MPVKVVRSDIGKFMDNYTNRLYSAVLRQLSYIGEKAVNIARSKGSYKDQTGNLRSSIGYVISFDGILVKMGKFVKSGTGTEGMAGVKSGEEFAKKVGTEIKQGFCLTMVAGREYAQYVAARGYDVLQSSEIEANMEAKKLVDKIKSL